MFSHKKKKHKKQKTNNEHDNPPFTVLLRPVRRHGWDAPRHVKWGVRSPYIPCGCAFFIGINRLYLPNGYVNLGEKKGNTMRIHWILGYWRPKQLLFDVWLTAWGVHIVFRFNMLKPYLGWLVEISTLFGNGVPSKRGLLKHVDNYVYFHDSQWFITTHLVGGLEHFLFFHILGTIIPFDIHIFQKGLKPPTSQWFITSHCFPYHEIHEIQQEYFSEIEKHEVKFQWHGDQDARYAPHRAVERGGKRKGRDVHSGHLDV